MVSVVAKKLKDQRTERALVDLFNKADVTKSGSITLKDYITICEDHGMTLDEDDLETINALVNKGGKISRNDFFYHVKTSRLMDNFDTEDALSDKYWEKRADIAFRIFDINCDGFVSKEEFGWMTNSKIIGIKEIEKVFQKCDTNLDGKLEYYEFRDMIMRQKERVQVKLRVSKEQDDIEAAKERERKREHRRKNPHLYKKYERLKREKLKKIQQSKENQAAQKCQ